MNVTTTIPPGLASTRALFDNVRESSRSQKQKGLDVLWEVLEQMRRDRVTDFSVSVVGPRLKNRGGISTEALRNPPAKDYREIIASYASAIVGDEVQTKQSGRSQIDVALEAIADPGMRAIFRQIVAENRMLKHQNDQLRSSFKSLAVGSGIRTDSSPQDDRAAESAVAKQSAEILPPVALGQLLPSECDALRAALDDGRIAENGWEIQPNGAITNDVGEVVLPPGFATSLAKAICILGHKANVKS